MTQNKILSLLVGFILIMNVFLISKIEDLNNRLESINQNNYHLQGSINNVTSNINQSLERFTREQSWITPVQINNEKSLVENDQGQAAFYWQIKDYQESSEVLFNYRMSESEEFKAIPAQKRNTGLFEVQIPVNIKEEPLWEVQTMTIEANSSQKGIAQKATEIKKSSEQNPTISCYVSMKAKDTVKSSEISYHDIGYLAYNKYATITGHIQKNNNRYDIAIFHDSIENNGIESIIAEFYDGSNLLSQKPLEVQSVDQNQNHHPISYFLTYNPGQEIISNIVLKVKFQNGKSFSKDIS